jgi:hypothetical protein
MGKVTSFLSLAIAAAIASNCLSQTEDPQGQSRGGSTSAAAARRAAVAAEVANAAAGARFAAIRASLGSMLVESMLETADSVDGEITQYREQEILKAMAEQLEQFLAAYPGYAEADVARALLARIYVNLGRTQDAIRVLEDFDPDRAAASDVLKVVMSIKEIQELAKISEDWLINISRETKDMREVFDAAFVAIRLEKYDLAAQILESARKPKLDAESAAAFVVGQADLVSRLLGRSPVTQATARRADTAFSLNPVIEAQLDVVQVDVAEAATEEEVQGGGVSDVGCRLPIKQADRFRSSKVYADIVQASAAGLQILRSMSRIDMDSARLFDSRVAAKAQPTIDIPVCTLVRALHLEAVHFHPGTRAARDAAIRIEADALAIGKRALPMEAVTTDGQRVSNIDLLGKVTLIEFFSATHASSVSERAKIEKLRQLFPPSEFVILTVSMDAAADRWVLDSAVEALELSGPVVFDGAGAHTSLARHYGVDSLPARILVAEDGTIAENRPWKLTLDALPTAIQEELAGPRKKPNYNSTALVVEDLYLGPPISASLRRGAEAASIWIEADAWVATDACQLALDGVDVEPLETKVRLKLLFDQSRRSSPIATTLTQVKLRAPLPATVKGPVKVYVDHATADAAARTRPLLLTVLSLDDTVGYTGPKLDVQLLSTDSLPPIHSLMIETNLAAEFSGMSVQKVSTGDDATDVYVALKHSPDRAARAAGQRLRLCVPLGKDIANVVRVHVEVTDIDTKQITPFAMAAKLEH